MPKTDYSRKIKEVVIADSFVIDLITADRKNVACIEGIPAGAFLIYAYWDDIRRALVLVIEHESFDSVPRFELPPTLQVIYRRDYDEMECEICQQSKLTERPE